MKIFNIAVSVIVILVIGTFITILLMNKDPMLNDVHNHADIRIFLNGEPYNLNQSKYISEKDNTLNPFMHLHDNDGDVLHQHISDGSLEEFFSSINMQFSKDCFVLDNATSYCNNGHSTLQMFVNGKENDKFEKYVFRDLDRILITYGSEQSLINQQIAQVTDKACIQSGKCPERGLPGNESGCTMQGGCDA
jgi:hypothetical protein